MESGEGEGKERGGGEEGKGERRVSNELVNSLETCINTNLSLQLSFFSFKRILRRFLWETEVLKL